jgi:hypothetical protein
VALEAVRIMIPTADSGALIEMAAHLRENGYLVFKVPPCNRMERGHGRHALLTRSAMCEGQEPVPHGFHSTHFGSFGPWNSCTCGRDFNDYSEDENGLTPWQRHMAEVSLNDSLRTP